MAFLIALHCERSKKNQNHQKHEPKKILDKDEGQLFGHTEFKIT